MPIETTEETTAEEEEPYMGPDSYVGIFGQAPVKCIPYTTSAEEAHHPMRRLKVELKGLLITTGPLTAPRLLEEYEATYDTRLDDRGFGTVEELMATMRDVIVESFDGEGTRLYWAKRSEKSEDLQMLISRQRRDPPSRPNRMQVYVAPTKTIGEFPCQPKAKKRYLPGDGPKSEERCCMIVDMVREIGQRSADQTETGCQIYRLKDYYYAETGLALLGKIHCIQDYSVELAHPRFAKFWRIMVEPHRDPKLVRYFIIVRSEGFYPTAGNVELSNSYLTSTQRSDTNNRPNDVVEDPRKTTNASVAQQGIHANQTATEKNLEWMRQAKVVEMATDSGPNYFVPLFFVAPHSVILSSYWGNENLERFTFYQEQLRIHDEQFGFFPVAVGRLVLGKEYIIRCEDSFARAIYVGQAAGVFSFVLLDCHALAQTTDVLVMPPSFSSRRLPCNAFLASIRGVQDIPQDLFATIEAVVRPQNSLIGGLVLGEIFYTNEGKTRLIDWLDPAGNGLWFSQFCLDAGAATDETAPKNSERESVEDSVKKMKESGGFAFDKEVEDLVTQQARPEGCVIPSDNQAPRNVNSARSYDGPPPVVYVPENVTCNTSIPAPKENEIDSPKDEAVKGLLSFLLRSTKFFSPESKDITPQISDFNADFFRSVIPDNLKREYLFHRMLATLYPFKLIWTGQAEQDALDGAIQLVSSWLQEMGE